MVVLWVANLSDHDNSNDDSVNGNSFAEDNANQVLGFDSWHFDCGPDETCADSVDSPVGRKIRSLNRETRLSGMRLTRRLR